MLRWLDGGLWLLFVLMNRAQLFQVFHNLRHVETSFVLYWESYQTVTSKRDLSSSGLRHSVWQLNCLHQPIFVFYRAVVARSREKSELLIHLPNSLFDNWVEDAKSIVISILWLLPSEEQNMCFTCTFWWSQNILDLQIQGAVNRTVVTEKGSAFDYEGLRWCTGLWMHCVPERPRKDTCTNVFVPSIYLTLLPSGTFVSLSTGVCLQRLAVSGEQWRQVDQCFSASPSQSSLHQMRPF